MITNVCIDGFNVYYGSLKRSPYKWLDLGLVPAESVEPGLVPACAAGLG